jgi:putative phage-type endonuclease
MMLIISQHEQKTPEWYADRLGKATGSHAQEIQAKGKTKGTEATTRKNYKFQLALERITRKIPEDTFTNKHIERGNELEKFARMAYEIKIGNMVEEIGFCYPDGKMFGCSPDGFIDNRMGLVEIKAPIPKIHYSYIQDNKVPNEYYWQVLHNVFVTGCKYCDFISYNEDMPEKLKLFVFRFTPTDQELKDYETELIAFVNDVDALTKEILDKCK